MCLKAKINCHFEVGSRFHVFFQRVVQSRASLAKMGRFTAVALFLIGIIRVSIGVQVNVV